MQAANEVAQLGQRRGVTTFVKVGAVVGDLGPHRRDIGGAWPGAGPLAIKAAIAAIASRHRTASFCLAAAHEASRFRNAPRLC